MISQVVILRIAVHHQGICDTRTSVIYSHCHSFNFHPSSAKVKSGNFVLISRGLPSAIKDPGTSFVFILPFIVMRCSISPVTFLNNLQVSNQAVMFIKSIIPIAMLFIVSASLSVSALPAPRSYTDYSSLERQAEQLIERQLYSPQYIVIRSSTQHAQGGHGQGHGNGNGHNHNHSNNGHANDRPGSQSGSRSHCPTPSDKEAIKEIAKDFS
ncbi:hypothetical protein ABKN59_003866 [Abortiporus biennis]